MKDSNSSLLKDPACDSNNFSVCVVAILKDEEKFIDEWLVYHKMIGVSHFFLYDDSTPHSLSACLQPHSSYISVINWERQGEGQPGFNNQMKAFNHAIKNFIQPFDWVLFLDGDEYVVLRNFSNIRELLLKYHDASAVSLSWYMFGHNGYYDDPDGLITASLTRRKRHHSKEVKTFSRTSDLQSVENAHYGILKSGNRIVLPASEAHINHYHCRSFSRWMKRAERGDAFYNPAACSPQNLWRLSKDGCLDEFVKSVSVFNNEQEDDYMLKYTHQLQNLLGCLR